MGDWDLSLLIVGLRNFTTNGLALLSAGVVEEVEGGGGGAVVGGNRFFPLGTTGEDATPGDEGEDDALSI